jgi:S-adenosylmethionine decarboxylase
MNNEPFGPHLTLDLIGCPKEILSDYNLHFDLLKKLPEMIGMTPITQPYVFPYSGLVPEDKGITGIVIIAESHLSVHSFEEKGYTFIDMFSCKAFDVEKAEKFIIDLFKPERVEKNLIQRGKDFPREDLVLGEPAEFFEDEF